MDRKKKFHKPRYNDYPPDDGCTHRQWKWNHVCIPCKKTAKRSTWVDGTPVCPECRVLMLVMPRFAPPKKQDVWWEKAETKEMWDRHINSIRPS